MRPKQTRSAGEGLERSCRRRIAGWIASATPGAGVELFSAWFAGRAYQRHRHETYAIGLTHSGIQVFDYRGSACSSTPGQVVALYPDEPHDGRAGTAEGFGYHIVYVDPGRLVEAVRALRGKPYPLPFVREAVSTNLALSRAIHEAFRGPLEPLATDSLVLELARGLMAGERHGSGPMVSRRVDVRAIERARQFLDAERTRIVHSAELESITGLTRYDTCRQFRIMFGTSPHRYLLMRRLEFARDQIRRARPLAEIACDAGFADQAHFTRVFKSGLGLTPSRYRALIAGSRGPNDRASSSRQQPHGGCMCDRGLAHATPSPRVASQACYAADALTGAVSTCPESVPSISSNERPFVSKPMNQKAMIPTTYQQAKYVNASPREARFAAGLIRSPAPMISASPSGPMIFPLLPTP
jgi:AraC-like DNA-binding protein